MNNCNREFFDALAEFKFELSKLSMKTEPIKSIKFNVEDYSDKTQQTIYQYGIIELDYSEKANILNIELDFSYPEESNVR